MDQSRNVARQIVMGMVVGAAIGAGLGFALDALAPLAVLGLVLGGAVGGVSKGLPNIPMRYPPHIMRRIALAFAVYLMTLFVAVAVLDRELADPWPTVVALVPVLPGLLVVWAIGSAVASLDEMQRLVQTEAMAIAFGGALLASFSCGLLEFAGSPPLSSVYLTLFMLLSWGIGKAVTMRRYE